MTQALLSEILFLHWGSGGERGAVIINEWITLVNHNLRKLGSHRWLFLYTFYSICWHFSDISLYFITISWQYILSKKKRNVTPLYGYTVQNISYVSRNWNMPHNARLLKMIIVQVFWRRSPTVLRVTHFCILHCQTELTHAVIHWLMSLTCVTFKCLCRNTFLYRTGIFNALFVLIFLSWPIRGYSVSWNLVTCFLAIWAVAWPPSAIAIHGETG